MNYEKEYDFLRKELDENKKNILERPFVAVSLGFAAIGIMENEYIVFIPPIIIVLLYFNLWFTINRMESSARIIAYIQIFIEEGREYIGWEKFLREYRKYKKKYKNQIKEMVTLNLEETAVPDKMGFYPQIWNFHLLFVALCLIVSIFFFVQKSVATANLMSLIGSIIGIFLFIILGIKKRVSHVIKRPESERTLIYLLIAEMDSQNHDIVENNSEDNIEK